VRVTIGGELELKSDREWCGPVVRAVAQSGWQRDGERERATHSRDTLTKESNDQNAVCRKW
jgi:hypothetical protein